MRRSVLAKIFIDDFSTLVGSQKLQDVRCVDRCHPVGVEDGLNLGHRGARLFQGFRPLPINCGRKSFINYQLFLIEFLDGPANSGERNECSGMCWANPCGSPVVLASRIAHPILIPVTNALLTILWR